MFCSFFLSLNSKPIDRSVNLNMYTFLHDIPYPYQLLCLWRPQMLSVQYLHMTIPKYHEYTNSCEYHIIHLGAFHYLPATIFTISQPRCELLLGQRRK
eukprot:16193_6